MSRGDKPMSGGDWCLLTTSPSRTLPLADALIDAGIVAWAPRETVPPKHPPLKEFERPRRRRKLPDDPVTRSLLPGFVFARADRLAVLLSMARSPAQQYQVWDRDQRRMVVRGHPAFKVFHAAGRIPLIPDHQMIPLRRIEERRKRPPRGKPVELAPGTGVRLVNGAFEGLNGVVVRMVGKHALVRIAPFGFEMKFYPRELIVTLDVVPGIHMKGGEPERSAIRSAA